MAVRGKGYTDEDREDRVVRAIEYIAQGHLVQQAANAVGVHTKTFRRWMEDHPDILMRVSEAKNRWRRRWIDNLAELADKGNVNANLKLLERSDGDMADVVAADNVGDDVDVSRKSGHDASHRSPLVDGDVS